MSFLSYIAPKSYKDGEERCNRLGLSLATGGKVSRFLDLGCGNGDLTSRFMKATQAQETWGVEFVDDVAAVAARKGITTVKFDLNGRWPLEDSFFDLILTSQNIEHMYNTRLYLEECFRCLKPGGRLIVLTENLSSWVNIISLVFGWQPFSTTVINGWNLGNPFIWHKDVVKEGADTLYQQGAAGIDGHVRVLSYAGLRDLLNRVGFEDVRLFTKGFLPLWGFFSDALCAIDRRHGHFLVAVARKKA